MTFEEIWPYTDAIPGSFTKLSGQHFYEQALLCPNMTVEIGVDQCRSGSLLLFAAMQTGARVILIDSWESILIDNLGKVQQRIGRDFPTVNAVILHMKSEDGMEKVWREYRDMIDLVHIDADHYDGVAIDCETWLPRLKSGGVACFHDFESCFPAVTDAINKYTDGWESLGNWDGLAIRRKP